MHLSYHPDRGTFQVRTMLVIKSPYERKDIFSLGRPKNFFISTTSQKKSKEGRKSISIPKNDSDCEECFSVSTEVQTTLGTKHPIIKGVRTVEGMHQDILEQDTELEILLEIMKTIKFGTYDWHGHSEVRKCTSRSCVSWFNSKQNCISHSTDKVEHIVVASGCTQRKWMKNMLKEYRPRGSPNSLL